MSDLFLGQCGLEGFVFIQRNSVQNILFASATRKFLEMQNKTQTNWHQCFVVTGSWKCLGMFGTQWKLLLDSKDPTERVAQFSRIKKDVPFFWGSGQIAVEFVFSFLGELVWLETWQSMRTCIFCTGLTSFLLHLTSDSQVEARSLKDWCSAQEEGGKVNGLLFMNYVYGLCPNQVLFPIPGAPCTILSC